MTRNVRLAKLANKHGARYSLRIIREANRAGIPISLAFALIEHESGFRNVFGHDAVANSAPKGGKVTLLRYRKYKRERRAGRGMQGVGPAQLTWWAIQDDADSLGGCWVPRFNIRVAFTHLGGLIKEYGKTVGLRRYNGAGPAAIKYSQDVRALEAVWHKRLS